MAFFYNEAKAEGPKKSTKPKLVKRADIPIASLQELGCSVCPRNEDQSLQHPKITPTGTRKPSVYLLGSAPNDDDDRSGSHWNGRMGAEVYDKFGKNFMYDEVRSGYIQQCRGDQTVVEVECCRRRVVSDIESMQPEVIVGIGDAVLTWATGITSTALINRGSFFPVKIGNHSCWFFCVGYPNYINKKSYNKSEYELTFEHDIVKLKQWLKENHVKAIKPMIVTAPYDTGIELITGNEAGDMQRLERALADLVSEPRSTVDIETNGLRPYMMKDPHMWTAAVGTFNRAVSFAIDHPEGWGTDARRSRVRSLFNEYLLWSGRKTAHNLSFELEWFAYFFGADCLRRTEWDDTLILADTLDERAGTKSLGYQTRLMFGFDIKALSNIDTKRLLEYPLIKVLKYNGLDTKWTDRLRQVRMPEILENPDYVRDYERKIRLAPTLVLTEAKGLPVDFKYAAEQMEHLDITALKLEGQIRRTREVRDYEARFGTFSPTNADHVLKLLKDVCQRGEVRVEDQRSGVVKWTTGEEVMATIPAKEVPSAALILEHRGVSKLRGTYVDPIMSRKIVCLDGKVRPKYSSVRTVTGRLAAEDPNVQNWPKRKFKEIRGIIAAEAGESMVALDYGQIEFRVVGMASGDRNLVHACWTGYDVHKFWAERMVALYPPIIDHIVDTFHIDWDEKGIKTLRQEAKNGWVFPQLFGSSVKSCAEQLHLPDCIANDLAGEFWDEFHEVKQWQEKLLKSYEKNLYVETLGGRRRRGPMTKNEIINMPIQGTAAEIVTEAMSAVSEMSYFLEDEELNPALNVHDDLSFLMRDENINYNMDCIAKQMCQHRFEYINVPLVVEASIGKNWASLKEVKVYRSNELFNMKDPYVNERS